MFKDECEFKRVISRLEIDTEPNPAHRENLRREMLSVFTEAGRRAANRTINFNTIQRAVRKIPVTRIAAAAVIMIGVFIALNQILGSTPTFAEVIKPIFSADTFAFDMLVGGEGGPVMHDRVSGSRIRRTISNLPDSVMVIDTDNAKLLAMDTSDKTASLIDVAGPLQEDTRNFIGFIRETITRLQENTGNKPQQQSGRMINGRKAIGYLLGNDREQVSVWADAKTAAPIEIELKIGNEVYVLKNFEYDIPISEDEMSMKAPAGYTMKQSPMDFSNVTENNLIESLRIWAQYLRDGTFPPELGTQQYMNQVPILEQKIAGLPISDSEKEQLGVHFIQGMLFLQTYQLHGAGPWHYAGKDVKFGDAETAIFWYRPEGCETYRVIYGDLSVKDVSAEHLPE